MKNYYEILEVDKNASNEMIKVAYKLLVKKYHPDLNESSHKNVAEEKIKLINEAYVVLSDPQKRNEYNQNLLNENISEEQFNYILNENLNLKEELNYYRNILAQNRNNYYNNYQKNSIFTNAQNNNYKKYQNFNFYDNYSNNVNTNYTEQNYNTNSQNFTINNVKNKLLSNYKETIKSVVALFLTLLIIFIVLKIPFINEFIFNIFSEGYIFIIIVLILIYIYFFRNRN